MSDSKKCTVCKEIKPLTDFYKRPDRKNSYSSLCKPCLTACTRKRRESNPSKFKEQNAKYYKIKRDKMDEWKTSRGCKVCGFKKHGSALDLHHTNPSDKEGNPGAMTWDQFLIEAEKCVVLCSNCHRMFHAGAIGDIL